MGPPADDEEEEDLGSGIRLLLPLRLRSRWSPLSRLLEGDDNAMLFTTWAEEERSDVDAAVALGGGGPPCAEGGLNFLGGEDCRSNKLDPGSPLRELERLPLPMT